MAVVSQGEFDPKVTAVECPRVNLIPRLPQESKAAVKQVLC